MIKTNCKTNAWLRTLPVLAFSGFMLVGCATGSGPITQLSGQDSAQINVNGRYATGQVSMPNINIPTLKEMQSLQAAPKPAGSTDDDKLRSPALRDAALSYGARGGLAWTSKQINRELQRKSPQLTQTYDFSHFLIKAPGGATILPPVISEAENTYEQSDADKTLRVADRYYEIIQQARLAPTAPLWNTYLTRSYSEPEKPSDALLPKNAGERDLWTKFVAEGWEQGREQAMEIFKQDLRRLDRDFVGMVRYSELLEKKQVSAPQVAESNLGVTGSGTDMRVNDRVTKITKDPRLNVNRPSQWEPAVSDIGPTEAATPPGESAGRHSH